MANKKSIQEMKKMKEKYKLMEGDGRVLSMLQEESIDCIITDHPWLDKLSNKGGTVLLPITSVSSMSKGTLMKRQEY